VLCTCLFLSINPLALTAQSILRQYRPLFLHRVVGNFRGKYYTPPSAAGRPRKIWANSVKCRLFLKTLSVWIWDDFSPLVLLPFYLLSLLFICLHHPPIRQKAVQGLWSEWPSWLNPFWPQMAVFAPLASMRRPDFLYQQHQHWFQWPTDRPIILTDRSTSTPARPDPKSEEVKAHPAARKDRRESIYYT
jgi:hypothetical protein